MSDARTPSRLAVAPGGDWLAALPELEALDRFVMSLERRSAAERLVALPRLMEMLRRPGVVADALGELDHRRAAHTEALLEVARELTRGMPGFLERWESQSRHLGLDWHEFEALRGRAQRLAEPEAPSLGHDNQLSLMAVHGLASDFEQEAIRVGAKIPELAAQLDTLQTEELGALHSALKRYEFKLRADPAWALELLEELAAEALAVDARGRAMPRGIGFGGALDRVRAGEPPTGPVAEILDRAWAGLRDLADELRLLVSTTRSRLLLIRRFATWASWYERDRLRGSIEDDNGAAAGKRPRKIEALLTEELQAFLFAAGLTPLSKPMVGRLEPDVLASLAGEQPLYVEAKQHSATTARGILTVVAQGLRQVVDSANVLAGSSLRLSEGFVVVFGTAGPAVLCDSPVTYMGVRIHVVFVDLAPWDARGARNRAKPVRVGQDELFLELAAEGRPAAGV